MAIRRRSFDPLKSSKYRKLRKQHREREQLRRSDLERLEERALMAVGPELFAIRPDEDALLANGAVIHQAPRDFKLLFRGGASIDPATVSNGVVLRRSGGDGVFDAIGAAVTNDIVVTPGFVGLGGNSNEIILRPAAALPDDTYRITLLGVGANSVRNLAGDPANGGTNIEYTFDLDLGPRIAAVVPQPINRTGVTLSQNANQVVVYFNDDDFSSGVGSHVTDPKFYRLTASNSLSTSSDDIAIFPTSVAYDATANTATLNFPSGSIGQGSYHLQIGTSLEPNSVRETAMQLGTLANVAGGLEYSSVGFTGDESLTGQVNDVDLYRIDLQPSAIMTVAVNPVAGHDTVLRLFDKDGNQIGANNAGGAGLADSLVFNANALGQTVYVGVSSNGNGAYNVVTGQGAAGGGTIGSYRFDVDVAPQTLYGTTTVVNALNSTITNIVVGDATQLPSVFPFVAKINQEAIRVVGAIANNLFVVRGVNGTTAAPHSTGELVIFGDDNSSFTSAAQIGVIGSGGQVLRGSIEPQLSFVTPANPGGNDEPGHRAIPVDDHLGEYGPVLGQVADTSPSIPIMYYNFQSNYGTDTQGNVLLNEITENQKDRAREIFELFSRYAGIEFQEVDCTGITDGSCAGLTIVTGDIRAVSPNLPPGGPGGVYSGGKVIVNDVLSPQFGNSENGGLWYSIAMHEIGHAIGLGHSYDLPSVMGTSEDSSGASGLEVIPTANDIVHMQRLYRKDGNDVDLYKFTVNQSGQFTAETIAERLGTPSTLDSALRLFQEELDASGNPVLDANGNVVRKIVAQNDDYYSSDSQISVRLTPGTYYLGVSSTGNTQYDPTISDSGEGGTTQGDYNLKLNFAPDPSSTLSDMSGQKLDGDSDGVAGGNFDFWFQAGPTIFVDKLNDTTAAVDGNGSIGNPYDNIATGLAAAASRIVMPSPGAAAIQEGDQIIISDGISAPFVFEFDTDLVFSGTRIPGTSAAAVAAAINSAGASFSATASGQVVTVTGATLIDRSRSAALMQTPNIVRVVGNAGADNSLSTPVDAKPYVIGFDNSNAPLKDGSSLAIPQGTTVMVDAGTVLKLQKASIDVGTSSQGVDRSAGALQVLGTPATEVFFRSFRDDTAGGNSDGAGPAPQPGDWGGIEFRADSDHEADSLFLSIVQGANIKHGGGKVFVDSVEETVAPIHLVDARPTIANNTITTSSFAAISADPNSFDDSLNRIGPDIHGNAITGDSVNGLLIRTRADANAPLDELSRFARFNDADIVHVLTDNLVISGTPGGAFGAIGSPSARFDSRLNIDPGIILKMRGARIEAEFGAQLIAEGTADRPIIVTSLSDDHFGAGGTFDSKNDGAGVVPVTGDWGGIVFRPNSTGSIEDVMLSYGGGLTPIEGGFDSFNTVEIHQADVRIANSDIENNSGGASSSTRNGVGTNSPAVIFVRGAQPVIVNNIIQNNADSNNGTTIAAISINANSLASGIQADYGPTRGLITSPDAFADNNGPLIRQNRLDGNELNGMDIRAEEPQTELVWDDTDIVHTVRNEIRIDNVHTFGGVRLQSSPAESLVVKFSGVGTGLTASGTPLDIGDRIGGDLQVIGQPGYPVVLTSINDCFVGAGFTPDGRPQLDTLMSGKCSGVTPVGNSGAVIIDGGDRDDHGFALAGPDGAVGTADDLNQDGWLFIQQMLSFTVAGARNRALNDILAIGVDAGTQAQDAIASAARVLGLNVTYVNDAQISSVNFSDYKVLYVPSDGGSGGGGFNFGNVQGGILQTEIDLLTARKLDIQNFVNAGGSLVALTEQGALTPYSWLELPLSFQIQDAGFGTDPLRKTQAAIDAGFTISDTALTNGTPYHNIFTGPPGFNGLVPFVLNTGVNLIAGDGDDEVVTLGLGSGSFGIGVQAPSNPGDWRGVKLDQYGNDRNVLLVPEAERANTEGRDINSGPSTAQFLGNLAPNEKSGDETRRLGFVVDGTIAADNAADVDVYSFTADAGTEVWFDIDRTNNSLDTMIELVSQNGTIIARSFDNSTLSGSARDMIRDPHDGIDWYTTNPRDAGMRVVLPGNVGQNTYFIRVRSQPKTGNENNLAGGQSRGPYQLQVRLQQGDEHPGSSVRFSDIRYAGTGIDVEGGPTHSLIAAEASETNNGVNSTLGGAQNLGNLLQSDRNALSVSGSILANNGRDIYRFTVDYADIQSIGGVNAGAKTFPVVFDIDFADGLTRADTTLSVFDSNGQLIAVGRDSDVVDDQPRPGKGNDTADLSRGSVGKLDPYIGTVQIPTGSVPAGTSQTFYVAVSSNGTLPTALSATFQAGAAAAFRTRLEPVDSIQRVVEDHIGFVGYTSGDQSNPFLPSSRRINPTDAALININSSISLSTHVTPFNLGDVQLYLSSSNQLVVANPFDGSVHFVVGNLGNSPATTDIAMRNDGQLYSVQNDPGAANDVAGQFNLLNTDNASEIASNNINVPNAEVISTSVDALAWPANRQNVYFSVNGGGTSFLYRADPNTGAITPITSPPGSLQGQITGPGVNGITTGMAFDRNGTLFGVSSSGEFYTISAGGGFASLLSDFNVPFSGLTLGPQNLENGAFRDVFFATTSNGRMFAIDRTGSLVTSFDSNADQVADTSSITIPFGITGLAFSPLDFNLWHPTATKGAPDVAGHGINPAFDNSRDSGSFNRTVGPNTDRRTQNEQQGGASLYFGLEEWNPNSTTYMRYAGGGGQYGVLVDQFQRDLTSNGAIGNNYNLPGGAHGSLTTNSFSLEEYASTDKPTLYFNYFLDSENAAGTTSANFRDSARVFISRDGGTSWELVATNNSALSNGASGNAELPSFLSASRNAWSASPNQQVQELFDSSGAWRQARVDLADYVGETSLRLRFDFSTAGRIGQTGLPGEAFGVGFNNIGTTLNNNFEGFYIDDIIVGFAERGEMVTGAPPASADFFTVPRDANAPKELLTGSYQLELRRGQDYVTGGDGLGTPISSLSGNVKIAQTFDTNDRLVRSWSMDVTDGASILDAESFSINDGLVTRVFEFDLDATLTSAANVRITVTGTETEEQIAALVASAINSANFGVIASIKPAGLNSNRVNLSGAVDVQALSFTTAITPVEFLANGDSNVHREQGQIVIESNIIRDSNGYGIDIGPAPRPFGVDVTYPGGVQSTPVLNTEGLITGAVVENNLIVNSRVGGIRFGGDPNLGGLAGPVPFGRIINNTIYGGEDPRGAGITVTNNASPTILNNVFSNLVNSIDTSTNGGTTVVIGNNLFQNVAPAGTNATTIADTDPLFVNPAESNFYLADTSLAIDSSINNLLDRPGIVAVKSPLGIPASQILAPERDVFGQLRVDDPTQNPPSGFGPNIFKDKGAIDRADTLAPFTSLLEPIDNDSASLDIDPNLTVVHLPTGLVSQFAIQLGDGRGINLPFEGTNLDPATINSESVRILRNGQLMRPGIDFTLGYSATNNTILLTPLSEIWQPDSVYQITLNNQDRFVIRSPDPSTLADGQFFEITDTTGNVTRFEYESGYTIQVPQTYQLQVPAVGAGVGGIADGQRFTVANGATVVTFEFDRNNNITNGNVAIPFTLTSTANDLANAMVTALTGQLGLRPLNLGNGRVHLGTVVTHSVTVPTGTNLTLTGQSGGVRDGQRFTVREGGTTYRFELSDSNVNNTVGNPPIIPINMHATDPNSTIADAIIAAIQSRIPTLSPVSLGNGGIYLGGNVNLLVPANTTSIDAVDSALIITGSPGVSGSSVISQPSPLSIQVSLLGAQPGGVQDGDVVTITKSGISARFELDNNNSVTGGSRAVTFNSSSSVTDIVNALIQSIQTSTLGISPVNRGNGLIDLRATGNVTVGITASGLSSVGKIGGINDGETFAITLNGVTTTFEFDLDGNVTAGNNAINITPTSTRDQIADAMVNVIGAAGLGLNPVRLTGGDVALNDTPQHSVTTTGSSLILSGVPGGAVAVPISPTSGLTAEQFAGVLINVINNTAQSDAVAKPRGGNTFFVDNVSSISFLPNLFLPAITDIAGNTIRSNQASGETEFTIILGNVDLDFGDARDSLATAEYPTLEIHDGARHTLSGAAPLFLGSRVDADRDGQPGQFAAGDDSDQSLNVAGSNLLKVPVAPFTIQLNPGTAVTTTGSLLADGESFSINDGVHPTVTFEFDLNGNGVGAGHVPVIYFATDGANVVADRIVATMNGQMTAGNLSGFTPTNVGGGAVFLGGDSADVLNLTGAPTVTVANRLPTTLQVPAAGPGRIFDGQTFVINDGVNPPVTFEFEDIAVNNGLSDAAHRPLIFDSNTYNASTIANLIASGIQTAIAAGALNGIVATTNGALVTISNPLGTTLNDDDGVVFHNVLIRSTVSQSITTPITVTASGPGVLDAWVDFNRDGDWNDPGEQVFVGLPVLGGANQLGIVTPVGATPGDTYVRFRISATGGLFPTGIAIGGEVEDYLVSILPGEAPVVVDDTRTVNEDTLLTLSGIGILANDTDANADSLIVYDINGAVGNVGVPIVLGSGATLTVNRDGSLTYDPRNAASLQALDGGATRVETFIYRANDIPPGGIPNGSLTSLNLATVTITVTGLNDAPVLDTSGVMTVTAIGEDSTNNPGTTVTAIVASSAANGGNAITDVDTSAVEGIAVTAIDNSNGRWEFATNTTNFVPFGAVSDASATLLSSNPTTRVRFVPNLDFHGTATISFRAWDITSGLNGQAGVDASTNGLATPFSLGSETATITVNAVNDLPVIALPGATPLMNEGAGSTIAITGISVSDVDVADSAPGTLLVTLTVPAGTLNLTPGMPGGVFTVTGNGTGTVSIIGTPSQVDVTLASLTYTVPNGDFNSRNNNGDVALVINADDFGRTPAPPIGTPTNSLATLNVSVAPVNDAPTIQLPGAVTLNEGVGASAIVRDGLGNFIRVDDVDVADTVGGTLQLTLTVPSGKGTLSAPGAGPAESIVVTGTVSQLNTTLQSLLYTVPTADFNILNNNGPVVITAVVDDQGNTGPNGNLSAAGDFTVTVNATNDPPVVFGPASVTLSEGPGSTFLFQGVNSVSVDDVDAAETGGGPISLSLTVPSGTGNLLVTPDLPSGVPLARISGLNTSALSLSGSVFEINTTLASLAYVVPNGDFNSVVNGGNVSLSLVVNDNGNTGLPTGSTTGSRNVAITVSPINDAPQFIPGPNQVLNEDAGQQSLAWASGIRPGPATATDEAGQTLDFQFAFVAPTTSAVFTSFSISPSGVLTYTTAPNWNGVAKVDVWLHDNGGTTNGGSDTSIHSTLTITVNSVNDAPDFTVAPTFVTGANNSRVVISEDPVQNPVNIAWASGVRPGPISAVDESGQTLNFSLTRVDSGRLTFTTDPAIDSAGNLTFKPAANSNGTAIYEFQLKDNGGTDRGGVDTTVKHTLTISVTAVNDTPFVANPIVDQTVAEDAQDTVLELFPTVFDDVDVAVEGDVLTFGVVSNSNSSLVQASVQGSQVRLKYLPNQNGVSSIVVQVRDAIGGIATDTFNVTVTPVNDPPAIVNPIADLTVAEDAANTNINIANVFTDVDIATNGDSFVRSIESNNNSSLVQATLSGTTVSLDYQPDAVGLATIVIAAQDTAGAITRDTFVVTVTEVNDAPIPGVDQLNTNEDTPFTFNTATLRSNDLPGPLSEASQTLSITNISPTSVSGGLLQFNAGTSQWTYTPPANFNGVDRFTYTVFDDGRTNGNPDALSAVGTVLITVAAVNDAPVLVVPGNQSVAEDGIRTLAGLSVSDVDAGSANVRLTLAAAHGTVTLRTDIVGGIAAGDVANNGTSSVVVNAPITRLNITLASTQSVSYQGTANFNGTDSVVVSLDDLGNVPGPGLVDTKTIVVTVTPVNDSPTIGLPTPPIVNEDVTLSIVGVTINDVDAVEGTGDIRATLSVARGTLTVRTDVVGGLTFADVTNNGTSSIVITGSPARINATFGASQGLTYLGNRDFNGVDSLSIAVSDLGNFPGPGELTANRSLAISVNPVNDAPVANNDAYTISEDVTLRVAGRGVLDNDTDVDLPAQVLVVDNSAAVTTSNLGAIVHLNSDGTFEYDPTTAATLQSLRAGQTVQDTFTYAARDGIGPSGLVSNVATATVLVQGVNDAPVASNVTGAAVEDGPGVSGNFAATDRDTTEQAALRYAIVAQPTEGTVTTSGAPGSTAFTFNPGTAFQDLSFGETRVVRFTYRATDNSGQSNANSNIATVEFTVTGVNDAPTAGAITLNTTEEGPDVTDLFLGADVDGDSLTYTVMSGLSAGQGTLVNQNNGMFTFRPGNDFQSLAAGAIRVVTFTYQVRDNSGTLNNLSSIATVSITVSGVNDAPRASDDVFTSTEDAVVTRAAPGVMGNDIDVDSTDVMRVTSSDARSLLGAVVAVNVDGSFNYDPRNAAALQALPVGSQVIDSFRYTVSDPTGASSTATATITVTGSNDAPVAGADTGATTEDAILVIAISDITRNDIDPDTGESALLQLASVSGTSVLGATVTTNGSGDFVYDPRSAAAIQAIPIGGRLMDTFTYSVRDPQGAVSTGTVTITVSGLNDVPVAVADSAAVNEDNDLVVGLPGVLGNDVDADQGESTLLSVTGFDSRSTRGAVVTVAGNGSFTYDPRNASALQALANGQTAVDTFTYTISDAQGVTSAGTVSVTVSGTNDAPVLTDDIGATDENTVLNVPATGLLNNDRDAENSVLSVSQINGNAASVGIPVTLSSGAIITVNANGGFVYDPRSSTTLNGLATGETFVDAFTYRATDGIAQSSNQGVIRITITGVNDAPIPTADILTGGEDSILSQAAPGVLGNDVDPDASDRMTVTTFDHTSARGAQVSVSSDGSFTYDPTNATSLQSLAASESAVDTFKYTVADARGGVSIGTVSITVNGQNDAPIARNDSYGIGEDSVLIVAGKGVLENDRDPDGSNSLQISVSDFQSSRGAAVSVNPDGTFQYDPTNVPAIQALRGGQIVVDTFIYQAGDGTTTSTPATVSITLTGVNDAPVARNDIYSVDEDSVIDVPAAGVLANDSDPEGDTISAIRVSGPSNGTLTLNSDGSFHYQPNSSFSGTDVFTYRARDTLASSPVATVTINVNPKNDKPATQADAYQLVQDSTLTVGSTNGVLANDTDPDGDSMTASLVNSVSHGSLTFTSNGAFVYRPQAGFFGTDTFRYVATDSHGASSDVTTVTLTVLNDKPHRNPRNRLDVNDDGQVTPIDALQVVNDLNRNGARQLPNPPAPPFVPPPYLDVNGDGFVTPADALDVINFLNGLVGGEGEFGGRLIAANFESNEDIGGLDVVSSQLGAVAPEVATLTVNVGLPRNLSVADSVQPMSAARRRAIQTVDAVLNGLPVSPIESNGVDSANDSADEVGSNGSELDGLIDVLAEEEPQSESEGSVFDAAIRGLFV